jgi:hypothetical protein
VAYELRLRWRAQREGRERLSGACYAILTGLESNLGGNRDEAAARLSLDKPVLSTIGKLAAREDPVHGRAYGKAGGAAGPLTEAEVKWLEAVTPRLIRQAAEYDAKVPSLRQITWPISHRYPTNGHHRCVPQIVPIRGTGHGFSSKGSL